MTMPLDRLKTIIAEDWDRISKKCDEVGVLPYENAINHMTCIAVGELPPGDAVNIMLTVAHSIASSDDPKGAFEELCSWASTVCDEKQQESIPVAMDKEKN